MLAPTNPWGYQSSPRSRTPRWPTPRDLVISQSTTTSSPPLHYNPARFNGFKRVTHVKHLQDELIDLRGHRSRSSAASASIASPDAQDLGAHIMEQVNYADHHNYGDADITGSAIWKPTSRRHYRKRRQMPPSPPASKHLRVVIDLVVPGQLTSAMKHFLSDHRLRWARLSQLAGTKHQTASIVHRPGRNQRRPAKSRAPT